MIILGIETSCDETAAAVVKDGTTILASVVSSQVKIHHRYGGVVPELASRKHIEAIVPVVDEALTAAGLSAFPPSSVRSNAKYRSTRSQCISRPRLTWSLPTIGMLFSAWHATMHAPQPTHAFRSIDMPHAKRAPSRLLSSHAEFSSRSFS